VFKHYCHRCHSGAGSEGGEFDVLDIKTLTPARPSGMPYITASKPEESFMLARLEKGSMPPKAIKERPTDEDKKAVRAWIEAGAPALPADQQRPRQSWTAGLT